MGEAQGPQLVVTDRALVDTPARGAVQTGEAPTETEVVGPLAPHDTTADRHVTPRERTDPDLPITGQTGRGHHEGTSRQSWTRVRYYTQRASNSAQKLNLLRLTKRKP